MPMNIVLFLMLKIPNVLLLFPENVVVYYPDERFVSVRLLYRR